MKQSPSEAMASTVAASFFDGALPSDELAGVMVVERSSRAPHAFISWLFPDLPSSAQSTVLSRVSFDEPVFSRVGDVWHYQFPVTAGLPSTVLPATSGLVLVVLSRTYLPERYLQLAKLLAESFVATGSPVELLRTYLEVFKTGRLGAWSMAAADPSRVLRPAGLAALLAEVGVEAILLWTALLLRKRVAVYGESAAAVIRAVRVLPQLVSHRATTVVDATGVSAAAAAAGATADAGSPVTLSADVGVPLYPLVTLQPGHLGKKAGDGSGVWQPDADTRSRLSVGVVAQLRELVSVSNTVGEAAAAAGIAVGATSVAALVCAHPRSPRSRASCLPGLWTCPPSRRRPPQPPHLSPSASCQRRPPPHPWRLHQRWPLAHRRRRRLRRQVCCHSNRRVRALELALEQLRALERLRRVVRVQRPQAVAEAPLQRLQPLAPS